MYVYILGLKTALHGIRKTVKPEEMLFYSI